jgi:hypothetical protein
MRIANQPVSEKVRLQTRAPGAPTSMLGTFVHVFKNNGALGLYSGVCAESDESRFLI